MPKRKTKPHGTDIVDNTSEIIVTGKCSLAKMKKNGTDKCTETVRPKSRTKLKTPDVDEKKRTVPPVKNRRQKKNAEVCAPSDATTLVTDNVSKYFPASADRARSRGRNMKAGNSSSYSSKIKKLKNSLTSEDATASESEFEVATVNYRSPEDIKKQIPENKKRTKRKALKIKTSDINVSIKDSQKVNVNGEHDEEKQKRMVTIITNRDIPCTVTHNRKRKSTDLEAGNENKDIVEKPKKKRESRKQTRCRKDHSENVKEDSLTNRAGQRARLINKVNNNKSLKKSGEKDNLAMLKQEITETRLEMTTPDESLLNESSDEEMMDVEENAAPITMATALPKAVDQSDAMAILMHMEGPKPGCSTDQSSTSTANNNHENSVETLSDDDEGGDSDDMAEWEDVEGLF